MNSISNTTNMLRQRDRKQGLVFTPTMEQAPSEELLASLQEIEDYKKGKIQLPTFDTTKELFDYLDN